VVGHALNLHADAASTSRAQSIFVSASIPDPERWDGEFDALEIN